MGCVRTRGMALGFGLAAIVLGIVIGVWFGASTPALADPPPGRPGTPAFRTLDEVEPAIPLRPDGNGQRAAALVINQSGSYYLTANLIGSAGNNGIEIRADNVVLDLRGYSLIGVAGSLDGIVTVSGRVNVRVFNGVVRAWGQDGVDLSSGFNAAISDLSVSHNAGDGVRINYGRITCVNARNNGSDGIEANLDTVIEGCTSEFNGAAGIRAGASGVVRGGTASRNTGDGVVLGHGCVVDGVIASGNGGNGFNATGSDGCALARCAARNNGVIGIRAGRGATVLECSITGGASGILADAGCVIRGCSAADCAETGIDTDSYCTIEGSSARSCGGRGIRVLDSAQVTDCLATGNGITGIRAGQGCMISRCNASENAADGFLALAGTRIADSTARGNSGRGFVAPTVIGCTAHANGSHGIEGLSDTQGRFERNTVINNVGSGITVSAAGFFVGANFASGNGTDYALGADVDYGRVIASPGPGFVNVEPWANFVE